MAKILDNPRQRVNYAHIPHVIDVPDLIETQQKSYQNFLQMDKLPDERENIGLQEVFQSVFPIKGRDGSLLEFCGFSFGRPKYNVNECVDRGMTYAVPLRIKVRLVVKESESESEEPEVIDVREEDIYLGELPLMTSKGTFIINGAERVVVSQLHRSPGIFFDHDKGRTHSSGKLLYSARTGAVSATQGYVYIDILASDSVSGVSGPPTVTVTDSAGVGVAAVLVETTGSLYRYRLEITSSVASGMATIRASNLVIP